jgi:hypothetical protein
MHYEVFAKRLDLYEPRVILASWKREAAKQMRFARVATGESDPRLKHDPCLLGYHRNRPTGSHDLGEFLEELKHVRIASSKQVFKGVLAAGVPHIFCDETFTAFWAGPERWEFRFHVITISEVPNATSLPGGVSPIATASMFVDTDDFRPIVNPDGVGNRGGADWMSEFCGIDQKKDRPVSAEPGDIERQVSGRYLMLGPLVGGNRPTQISGCSCFDGTRLAGLCCSAIALWTIRYKEARRTRCLVYFDRL